MPRKYRPPDSRRRRGKKTASPHIFQPATDGDAGTHEANTESAAIESVAPTPQPLPERSAPAQSSRETPIKHLSRDYSYVRGEVVRIVLVAGFLIVSLVITALLRN